MPINVPRMNELIPAVPQCDRREDLHIMFKQRILIARSANPSSNSNV
jgi:hypothetical protein